MQFAKRMPNASCMVLDQWLCLKNKRNSFFLIGEGGLEIFSAFCYKITPQKSKKIKITRKVVTVFLLTKTKKFPTPPPIMSYFSVITPHPSLQTQPILTNNLLDTSAMRN